MKSCTTHHHACERLEKAQTMYGSVEFDWWASTPRDPKDDRWQHTHTARLVCIEEIK